MSIESEPTPCMTIGCNYNHAQYHLNCPWDSGVMQKCEDYTGKNTRFSDAEESCDHVKAGFEMVYRCKGCGRISVQPIN